MQEFGNSESELLKKLGDDLSESKDLDLVQRKVFTICEQITQKTRNIKINLTVVKLIDIVMTERWFSLAK